MNTYYHYLVCRCFLFRLLCGIDLNPDFNHLHDLRCDVDLNNFSFIIGIITCHVAPSNVCTQVLVQLFDPVSHLDNNKMLVYLWICLF